MHLRTINWRPASLRFLILVSVLLTTHVAAPVAAQSGDSAYLALGDSVPFGYNPLLDPRTVSAFVGYPEAVAAALHLPLTNAACPGEASGGFVSPTGVDNSCRPYRRAYPLHVAYTAAQIDFAVAFLREHPRTQLVTISIGANDLFVLQKGCTAAHPGDATATGGCIAAGLPATLDALAANLAAIYGRLRGEGNYQGDLVAVTYYATDYRDRTAAAAIGAADQVVIRVTGQYGGMVADGFGAFQRAATPFGGDTCAAGLLIRKADGTCDIHPSTAGRDLLAATVLALPVARQRFFNRRLGDG